MRENLLKRTRDDAELAKPRVLFPARSVAASAWFTWKPSGWLEMYLWSLPALFLKLFFNLPVSLPLCSVGHQSHHVPYALLLWPPALGSPTHRAELPETEIILRPRLTEHTAGLSRTVRAKPGSLNSVCPPCPAFQPHPAPQTGCVLSLCRGHFPQTLGTLTTLLSIQVSAQPWLLQESRSWPGPRCDPAPLSSTALV